MLTPDNIKYLIELFYKSSQIPIQFITLNNNGDHILQPFNSIESQPPLIQELLSIYTDSDQPAFYQNKNEYFFTINYINNQKTIGFFMVGPVLFGDSLSIDKQDRLVKQAYLIPVTTKQTFINHARLLHFSIYQVQLDMDNIQINPLEQRGHLLEAHSILEIANRRQNLSMHHDYHFEQKILHFIKMGDKEKVISHWRNLSESGELGVLSTKSEIRDKKNLAITTVTLATRMAIEGGVQAETAYTLSDYFIQNVEELRTLSAIEDYIEDIMISFADLVKKNQKRIFSQPINQVIDFIFKHLYDPFSLNDLAQYIKLHPHYLSKLFKKEVGMTIKKYRLLAKIEEAKSLLTYSNLSLLEISTLLNFNDQSHFTHAFKKEVNITPLKYRQHKGRLNDNH
ncbi:helix-turn-helix domain-containing protein [Amphibacillus jilinensis]|uniref:helix-turn-helix domain-containing protein n=1 Tax=Amphibacillus jilinensis TaxID=1216008 RepID=UPI0002FDF6CA|nr:helix-turn-helix domain-containing protein [Amphibacillus jilinensis]